MIRNISIGIDVGSERVRVVVGEFIKGEKNPRIIGIGEAESRGIRHGYVTSFPDAVESVRTAVAMAEQTSKIKIRRAFIAVGGTSLKGETSTGIAIVSKADGEVTTLDVNKALEECEGEISLTNKKVIAVSPLSFRLDGKEIEGKPEGMRGTKLEARALIITAGAQHLEDLLGVIGEAGVDPIDVIPMPIAGSVLPLSKKQKIVGSLLVNIGAETTIISVFENDLLISLQSFPTASENITNDLALGLKITLEEAEDIKLGNGLGFHPKKKIDDIIEARLSDIFELIENHLKKLKRSELLPAGIVFVGGGANTPRLADLSKEILKLPSRIGTTDIFAQNKTKLKDPAWLPVLGLLYAEKNNEKYSEGSFGNLLRDLKHSVKSLSKQLLP